MAGSSRCLTNALPGESSRSWIFVFFTFLPPEHFTEVISVPLLIQNDVGKILPDT